ncbi:MAG: DUF3047 domain-containing protein [Ramlibacter sp.]|nr:DUF3047 domain-containing protein [Ramlibacter sp.]
MNRFVKGAAVTLLALVLAACASVREQGEAADGIATSPWARQSDVPIRIPDDTPVAAAGWKHMTFPGKQPTRFGYARKDGRDTVAVLAASSASMMRNKIRIEPAALGQVRFSWKVPHLIEGANLDLRDADDSPVRIVLAFEGDRTKFSAKDSMLSELTRALTGEEMPYATLMYVWCNDRAPGSVVRGPRTDRIRKLVVESGAGKLNQWLDYERDIAADFERAFGEKPGALVGIGIMTDSDNTRSTTTAWYGPLRLGGPRPPSKE